MQVLSNTLRLEDLTDNRVVIVGVNGEVEDDQISHLMEIS